MQKDAITFKINSKMLLAHIALLRDQLLIANFVGPKPPIREMNGWLQALNQEVGGCPLIFSTSVGN